MLALNVHGPSYSTYHSSMGFGPIDGIWATLTCLDHLCISAFVARPAPSQRLNLFTVAAPDEFWKKCFMQHWHVYKFDLTLLATSFNKCFSCMLLLKISWSNYLCFSNCCCLACKHWITFYVKYFANTLDMWFKTHKKKKWNYHNQRPNYHFQWSGVCSWF